MKMLENPPGLTNPLFQSVLSVTLTLPPNPFPSAARWLT